MTPTAMKALDIVRDRIETIGVPPTLGEIGHACGCSRPAARQLLRSLEDSGFVRVTPAKHRGIALADRPDLRKATTASIMAELARRGKTLEGLSGRAPVNYARGAVTCAGDACFVEVQRGMLFCREHWFSLPRELRDRILATFGAKDIDGYQDAVTEARGRIDGSYFQRREAEPRQ